MKLKEQIVFGVVWKGKKFRGSVYDSTMAGMKDFIKAHKGEIMSIGYSSPGTYKNLDELKRHKDWIRGTFGLPLEYVSDFNEDEALELDDIPMKYWYGGRLDE